MKAFICVVGWLKLLVCRLFSLRRIRGSLKVIVFPSVMFQVSRKGTLRLGSSVSIRRNTEINVRNEAEVTIGNGSFINSGCVITAHRGIRIGDNVELGSHVMIYDHDHDFRNGYEARKFETEEVYIGSNVWIGSGCVILRGTRIGDNCVIGAGSVVKGTVPDGSVFIQKRNTQISTAGVPAEQTS